MTRNIFVFGSNLAGRHGKGAALYAKQHHGAISGQGIGLQGDSYAIPTKDSKLRTLPLEEVSHHVEQFKKFAADHSDITFQITLIGCGLAGYTPDDISPMFADAPDNCILPDAFIRSMEGHRTLTRIVHTPWGIARTEKEIAPGITFYTTAAHGGFHLSEARIGSMPKPLREFEPWAGYGWYEQDCDWCAVVVAFPQFFTDESLPEAMHMLKIHKVNLYNEVVAAGIAGGRGV